MLLFIISFDQYALAGGTILVATNQTSEESSTFINTTAVKEHITVYNLDLQNGSTFIASGMVVDAIGGIWKNAGLHSPPPLDWYYQNNGIAPTPPQW